MHFSALFVAFCTLCHIRSVHGSYGRFHALYEYWKQICGQKDNNYVLESGMYQSIKDWIRPWSMSADTIHTVFKGKDNLSVCSNAEVLSKSVEKEIPNYDCNVEWLSNDEICIMMSKYSKFYFFGDSLIRHMSQAYLMIMSNDFRYGGFPRVNVGKPTPYHECGCDGQFSEYTYCRSYSMNFNFDDIRNLGFCSHVAAPFNPFAMQVDISYKTGAPRLEKFCTEDTRPKFIFIQGGTHFDTSSFYYWKMLKSFLTSAFNEARDCAHPFKLVVAYSGVIANSQTVSDKYPDQRDANTKQFNEDMKAYLKTDFPQVTFLNFWNLSKEFVLGNRTSDGFHSLSDSNLIKTMVVLNAAKLLAPPTP